MSFQHLLQSHGTWVDEMVIQAGTDLELLDASPDRDLPYVLLSILLAVTMHDRDAAFTLLGVVGDSALASANGVGGGSWQVRALAARRGCVVRLRSPRACDTATPLRLCPAHPPRALTCSSSSLQEERELAWCTNLYCVIDAINVGADFEGKKQPICALHGYGNFASMLMDQVSRYVSKRSRKRGSREAGLSEQTPLTRTRSSLSSCSSTTCPLRSGTYASTSRSPCSCCFGRWCSAGGCPH